MDKVRDNLYIGSWQDAKAVLHDSKWLVVTVAKDSPVIGAFNYPITDPGKDEIDQPLQEQAIQTVIDALEWGAKSVLVHCVSGVNRSASVVIGALMKTEKLTLADAHNVVKAVRPGINPINQQLKNVLKSVKSTEEFSTEGFSVRHLNEHQQIVEKCYREILGRGADPDGMRHYSERLAVQSGWDEAKLRASLLKSEEYKMKQAEIASKHGIYGKPE